MRLRRILERYVRGWFPHEPKVSRQWSKYGLGVALFAFLSLSFAVYALLNSSFLAYVGASSILWSRTYGGADREVPSSFITTYDGGYAIIGWTLGNQTNEWWLLRTDESGNLLWTKKYSWAEWQLQYAPVSMIELSGGGYTFAGTTDSATRSDGWLAKTDEAGNIIWNQTYDSGGADEISTMIQTPDGGYLLAGTTGALYYLSTPEPPDLPDEAREEWQKFSSEPSSGLRDAWLVKIDASGNVVWDMIYPGGNDLTNWEVSSLVATSDGEYALAGSVNYVKNKSGSDFWLAKTDGFGNLAWSQSYGGAESDKANCLLTTSDGGYIMAGSTSPDADYREDFYLVKTDANGNMQWNKTFGETNGRESNSSIETMEAVNSLVETSDGGYLLIGSASTYDLSLESPEERYLPVSQGCWLVKTDGSGNMEWNQTLAEKDIISLVEKQEGYAFAGRVSGDVWLGEIGEFDGSLELMPHTSEVLPYTALIPIVATAVVVLILFRNTIVKRLKKIQ